MEEIQDFLSETSDYWSTKDYNEALADAESMSPELWHKKWDRRIQSNSDLVADFYNLKNSKSLPERIRSDFGEFNFEPPKAWKDQVYGSKYTDIPRDEFERVISNMKKYKSEEDSLRRAEADKISREQEIKDWPFWRNAITSDYAKQRYINEPETAIFGEQAPGWKGSSTGAKADFISGMTAGATDFIPPAWWLGPIIRTGRNAAYYDTEYGKSLDEIGKEALYDFGLNKGARWLNNASREAKAARRSADSEVSQLLKANEMKHAVNKGLDATEPLNTAFMNDAEIIKKVRSLPEGPMKNELMSIIDVPVGRPINRQALADTWGKYQYLKLPSTQQRAREALRGNDKIIPLHGDNPYLKETALATPLSELSLKQKAAYGWNKAANAVNTGWQGQLAMQQGYNLKGRGGNAEYKFDKNSEDYKKEKNAYIMLHGKDWELYGKAFKPKQKEGPLIDAYREVTGDYE